jgi:hypothetical protein
MMVEDLDDCDMFVSEKKTRKSRKSKNRDYADEDEKALLTADEALLQAARRASENYKGSPVTKEEFLQAFDQRLEDMRDE